MINIFVPFRMSDGTAAIFPKARALSVRNRQSFLDRILENTESGTVVRSRDIPVGRLIQHYIESGRAERDVLKERQSVNV